MRIVLALSLLLLLSTGPASRAQTTNEPEADDGAASLAPQKDALLLDLRALEAESKELLKPVDAASARAGIADAAWTLEREWAKKLLREAFELTFPEEVDRKKTRARAVGSALSPPTPEDAARGMVRRRILKIALREKGFAEELAALTGRELGGEAVVMQYAGLASRAVEEGKLEEAGDYILRALDADPTLIGVAPAINALAERDRAAADRLIIEYVERLRSLPLSAYAEFGGTPLRVPFVFMMMLAPGSMPASWGGVRAAPGREAVGAYIIFVLDTVDRLEQAQAGGSRNVRGMLLGTWPLLIQHAPELAGRFQLLERLGRRQGDGAPALLNREQSAEKHRKRLEDRLKIARQTKDPLDVEMAVSSAMNREDFAEARKLLELLKDGDLKAKLSEEVNTRECIHLTARGDAAGAEKVARLLSRPQSVLRAYPPLIKRLVKNNDASSASILTATAVRLLKEAEERGLNDTYFPTLLAPVAGSVNPFKQSRSLLALSELAAAIEPASDETALEILEEVVRFANKNGIVSENGNPNLNADVFMLLAVKDESRVRHAAGALQDRLQRIAALAALYRGKAEFLDQASKKTRVSTNQLR